MKRILVIDPEASYLDFLVEVLGTKGHEVIPVRSVSDAAELLRDDHFDLIITEAFDQTSPFRFDPGFLDGLNRVARGTPILLSSTHLSVTGLRPDRFGLAGVLPKPYRLADFERKVSELLDIWEPVDDD